MSSSQTNTSTVSKISGINSQIIEMDLSKSGEDTTAMNSNTQNTPTLTFEETIKRALGDDILQLEEEEIKPFTDAEVRMLRRHTVKSMRARNAFRAEVVEARTNEISHCEQMLAIKAQLKAKDKPKQFSGLKLSISVSKAKAGAHTYILNGNGEKARESLNRMKEKYGIMMEHTLEGMTGVLSIVDVEHPNQRTSRDYVGNKDTENARQLGKNIMNTINYVENMIRIFC